MIDSFEMEFSIQLGEELIERKRAMLTDLAKVRRAFDSPRPSARWMNAACGFAPRPSGRVLFCPHAIAARFLPLVANHSPSKILDSVK
jgi:hypothetical protein